MAKIRVLDAQIHKARLEWTCSLCPQKIKIGDIYCMLDRWKGKPQVRCCARHYKVVSLEEYDKLH